MLLLGVAAGVGTNVCEQAWAYLGRLPSSALAVTTADLHAVGCLTILVFVCGGVASEAMLHVTRGVQRRQSGVAAAKLNFTGCTSSVVLHNTRCML